MAPWLQHKDTDDRVCVGISQAPDSHILGPPDSSGQGNPTVGFCPLSSELLGHIETPALVFVQSGLESALDLALAAREEAGLKVLYAVKAMSLLEVLDLLSPRLDGFAVSSAFEAQLIRDHFPGAKTHFTSPGVAAGEAQSLGALCDFLSANSWGQVDRLSGKIGKATSLGVRVNSKISNVSDCRYDPCRPESKLGVPIERLPELLAAHPAAIEGLHFHTNSDSTDFGELLENARALADAVPEWQEVKWVNFGGGYLFEETPLGPLTEAADLMRSRFDAEVYMEPGAGLVRAAGYLVGSVLDAFEDDDKRIAILDIGVNHMPEVLEFDYQPSVAGQPSSGPLEHVVAGPTCLAGDIFGTYGFAEALTVGQKVVFGGAGAYTLVKAHRFNGVNLPQVGIVDRDGQYQVIKTFGYRDFASFWKADV